MRLLVFNDVLKAVIKDDFNTASHKAVATSILNNTNSIFLYSKKMLEILRDSLLEEDMVTFQALVTRLSDTGENIPSSPNSLTMEDEALNINSTSQNSIILNIAYDNVVLRGMPQVAIISNQVKTNYHWLVCNLAILHPNKVTVNCWDFTSNAQIEIFFRHVFSIPKNLLDVNIFDTQCNFEHNIFDHIIRRVRVNYYTKKGSYSRGNSDEDNFALIRSKFISNFRMFTAAARYAHGRRVIFNEVVVTADNDYWNLKVDEQDWTVDVQISEFDTNRWLQRCSKYARFISRINN